MQLRTRGMNSSPFLYVSVGQGPCLVEEAHGRIRNPRSSVPGPSSLQCDVPSPLGVFSDAFGSSLGSAFTERPTITKKDILWLEVAM